MKSFGVGLAACAVLGLSLTLASACSSSSPHNNASGGSGGSAGANQDSGPDAPGGAAGGAGAPVEAGPDAADAGPLYNGNLLAGEDCDPMVPTECGLPFPSSVYLAPDPSTPTGYHVAFGTKTLPKTSFGKHQDPTVWTASDGFSPGSTIMTHMPGATITGLPDPNHIADSLNATCPTVLLDADTGKLVPHWSELDVSNSDDTRRVLMIRPAVRLDDDTRYIVAIRNIVDTNGTALAPNAIFKELRDGLPATDPSVTARRALYANIFEHLADAGINKGNLQIAWDFKTASRQNNTSQMVSMRDQTLAAVGTQGPSYNVFSVRTPATDSSLDPSIGEVIDGTVTLPLYLDKKDPGGTLQVDAQGKPKQNGTADFLFTVLVPQDVIDDGQPVPIVQYGHGLLGDSDDLVDKGERELASREHMILFGTNWLGLTDGGSAPTTDAGPPPSDGDDEGFIGIFLLQGDMTQFTHIADRLRQGVANALGMMRLMTGAFVNDPNVQVNGTSLIDPTRHYYFGDSQGGLMGVPYMALTTDVTRGYLGEMGEPYTLLLKRSEDFTPFFQELAQSTPDPIDQQLDLQLVQMLWDRAEPEGYSPYITANMLPNTPKHTVLMNAVLGDHEVTPIAAGVLARTMGATNIGPTVSGAGGIFYGLSEVDVPPSYSGDASFVLWDFGQPAAPITNVPDTLGQNTHDWVLETTQSQDQMAEFFANGDVESVCGGPCSLPEPP
jgi:hypothetical protein